MTNSNENILRNEMLARLGWAMFLRVIAVTVLLGATAIMDLRTSSSPFTVSLVSIYIIIAVTYVFTAISGIMLRWIRRLGFLAYIQVFYDILLITALISVTGRIFSFLFILAILSASIILHRPGAIVAAWLSSIAYGGLLFGVSEYGRNLRYINRDFFDEVRFLSIPEISYNIGTDAIAFFVVAFLASYLTEKLRRTAIELSRKEEDFQTLEAFSEKIIRSLPSGLITTDNNGDITSFNEAAEFITGKKSAETIGSSLHELFENIDFENCPPEITFVEQSGKKRFLGLSLSVLRSGKGEELGRIIIFQDQTVYREMEQQLKISDRLAAVGQLAAGLAHEVRNPLASISGSIQLLRRDARFSDDDRLFRILLRETDRLNQLITEFLHFARPSQGQLVAVNMKELLGETIDLFQNHAKKSDSLHTELECPANLDILLDTKLLHQVLWNLLINAAQAMPDGGKVNIIVEPIKIKRDSIPESGIGITISDTGPGIPQEIQDKIFAPFFTTKEYGTGLGLAIAYRSVESMGGVIKFTTREGRGTSFIIELPVKHADTADTSREAIS